MICNDLSNDTNVKHEIRNLFVRAIFYTKNSVIVLFAVY